MTTSAKRRSEAVNTHDLKSLQKEVEEELRREKELKQERGVEETLEVKIEDAGKDEPVAAFKEVPIQKNTLTPEEKKQHQDAAKNLLQKKPYGNVAPIKGDAGDEINHKYNSSPKSAVEGLKSNDPGYTCLNLSGNTIMTMKHREYVQEIVEALKNNTYVEEVNLSKCELDSVDAKAIADCLTANDSILVLNLEKNKINNEGASEIANGLRRNKRLVELNLLGQNTAFGDQCLADFIDLFDYNVTLTKIIWRLDSRKSFAINKLIVRNNTIQKWLSEGKDVSPIVPFNCFVEDLRVLYGGGGSRPNLDVLGVDSPVMSPSVGRKKADEAETPVKKEESPVPAPVAFTRSDSFGSGSPKVQRHSNTATLPPSGSPKIRRQSKGSPKSSPNLPHHSKEEEKIEKDSKENAAQQEEASQPPVLQVEQTPPVIQSPVVETPSSGSTTPMKTIVEGLKANSSPNSPSSRRASTGSLRKQESPSVIIEKLEADILPALKLEKNVTFAMKQYEYCQRIGKALATNKTCTEISLPGCEIDGRGAQAIAEGLAKNRSVRILDLSSNKISNEGSTAIAEMLKTNFSINEINLLGQPHPFGESCLEVWLNMLESYNISLRKMIWRLDSRKSFPINKLIVRNNTIKKFLDEGKDLNEGQQGGLFKIPETANCDPSVLKE